jgi:hypothetical protein
MAKKKKRMERKNGKLTSSQGSTWTFLLNFGVLISMNAAATAYSNSDFFLIKLLLIVQRRIFSTVNLVS